MLDVQTLAFPIHVLAEVDGARVATSLKVGGAVCRVIDGNGQTQWQHHREQSQQNRGHHLGVGFNPAAFPKEVNVEIRRFDSRQDQKQSFGVLRFGRYVLSANA